MTSPERKQFRTVMEVYEDKLWPEDGSILLPVLKMDLRHQGIAEALCRIPLDGYRRLKVRCFDFDWFIPDEDGDALVQAFFPTMHPERPKKEDGSPDWNRILGPCRPPKPHALVIYLSPRLERRAWDIVVVTVAHELAHIALNHCIIKPGDSYEIQEEEASRCTCEWGFEWEERKRLAVNKWRDSRHRGRKRKRH